MEPKKRHRLLAEQLKAAGFSEDAPPSATAWRAFLDSVENAYEGVDHVPGGPEQPETPTPRRLSTAEFQRLYENLRRSTAAALTVEREKLRRAEAALDAVIDAAPGKILVVDQNRRIIAYSREFTELVAIPPEVLESHDDVALISAMLPFVVAPDEFANRTRRMYEEASEPTCDVVTFQDGRVLERYSSPIKSPAGDAWGRAWIFRDVTTWRRAEEDVLRTNVFLDSLVENIPDMIFVKDAKTLGFHRLNRAAEELIGMSRDALIGKTDYDLFPAAQAVFFQAKDRATLDGGTLVDIPEEPIETARGVRWLHTKKIPLCNELGEPEYLLGISADITELRAARELMARTNEELERRVGERTAELHKTEAQLRLAQRMEAVGRLAGGVAHDFNNMLAVVLGCAGMLLEEIPPESPLRKDIEEIQKAGQRSAALTRQLLAFSRQQVLAPKPLDLNSVIADMETMFVRLIGEDVRCVTRLDSSIGRIEVDPSQLEQVILNLAVNARDAMVGGGVLTIETSAVELDAAYANDHEGVTPGPHVLLTVLDTGTGMDEGTRARIFDPFFTTKERGHGTGLGLATVYGVIKQSGGHIAVESELGRGTAFRVYFPRYKGEREPALAPSAVVNAARGHETVLLVEDQDLVRGAARRILLRGGYDVLEASNADDALAMAKGASRPIHLLLTDVILPGMNGRELAGAILALKRDLRVLYMSGHTDNIITEQTEQGVCFLQKPFTPMTLLERVRATLDAQGTV